MKKKLFLSFALAVFTIVVLTSAMCGNGEALQYEKYFRGNVLHQGIIRTAMPPSGPNKGYWVNTTGQYYSVFDTKTDTAKFFNLDYNYTDDTGSETAYGLYLNFDDNTTAASTFYMITMTSEGDANSTSYGLYVDTNWTVGIDCDSPVELDSLDIEPATNIDALDITGTNITSAALIDMDSFNTSGSMVILDYKAGATTLAGATKGLEIDLDTNVTLDDQNLIGISLTMPSTYGSGSEHGIYLTGDGQTVTICDDAVGMLISEGTAGDALQLTVGTAGDVQALVIDATTLDSTSTAGIVDIDYDTNVAGIGMDLAITCKDDDAADIIKGIHQSLTIENDTTSADVLYGHHIDITQNDTDAAAGIGLYISANDAGGGEVEAGIKIHNDQATDIDLEDGIIIIADTAGSMPDGLDVSSSNIDNAVNVGDNDIEGTTATITFTDIQIDTDGKIAMGPDTAGDAIAITTGAAQDIQGLVFNGTANDSTATDGIVDLNVDSSTTGAEAINIALTCVDDDAADTIIGISETIVIQADSTAADTVYGQYIDITQNDTDAAAGIGLYVIANDAGAGVVEAGIKVHNDQASDIDMTDGIIIVADTAGSMPDGVDVSSTNIDNAVNVGDNDIEGTTATLTFTDIQIDADGKIALGPDTAGDAIAITTGGAADIQGLVFNGTTNDSTATDGIIDLNVDSSTTGAEAINIALTCVDDDAADTIIGISETIVIQADSTAADTVYGQYIDITQNDTDAAAGIGLYVVNNDAGAGALEAGIKVHNDQATDIDITDGIIVVADTADSIVDGLDVSSTNITNAVNVGDNILLGTTATIDFTDFDVDSDGKTIIAPDSAGDALTLTGFAGDFQGIVIDASTADSTNTAGLIDIGMDTNVAGIGIDLVLTAKDDDAADTITGINQTIIIEADSTAADVVYGHHIDITQNDTDAAAGYGLYVTANDDGAGLVSAGIVVENLQATDIDMTDGIIVRASTNNSIVDGIDVSDAEITNAINIGTNEITGTDFTVDSDGKVTLGPDNAGDALSIINQGAADVQAIVLNFTGTTSTQTGGLIDIDLNSATSTASGINMAFTTVDDDAADTYYGITMPIINAADTTADDTFYGYHVDITQNDTDNPLGYGLYISVNDSSAGEVAAGVLIDNLQSSDLDLDAGVLVRATTTDAVAVAFDASDPEITTALAIGTNPIDGTDFDVDNNGQITLLPDTAGDAIAITYSLAADTQALVYNGTTNDSTATAGIIDLNYDTSTSTGSGINIALTAVDDDAADTLYGITIPVIIQADSTAADTVYGYHVDITQNDTDAPTGVGMYIVNNDSGAGELSSGILIENAQATDIDMDAGIVIQATTAGSLPTAIDISDAEITDGINIGENLITGNVEITGLFQSDLYHWIEEFDDEVAAVQLEGSLIADFWTSAGTNYAAANVTYEEGPGGTLDADTAGADSDSVTLLGAANIRVNSNPIVEFRFKVDDVTTCFAMCGLVEGSFASKDAPDDDIYLVGIDADNGHTFGATQIVALSNNDNGGAVYDDMGSTMSNDTYVVVRFDLTDVAQPRVWINGSEVAAASILDEVQAGTTLMPYIMVESLAGPATPRTLTIDYIRVWQDRG